MSVNLCCWGVGAGVRALSLSLTFIVNGLCGLPSTAHGRAEKEENTHSVFHPEMMTNGQVTERREMQRERERERIARQTVRYDEGKISSSS